MSRAFVLALAGAGLRLLQNTLFGFIAVRGVQPDLALIVTAFVAFRFGRQGGQVAGFLIGITEDAVGATPFGFHSLVRLIHGNLAGLFHGNVAMDALFVPAILVIVSFGAKVAGIAVLTVVFGLAETVNPIWNVATLFELTYTVLVTPIVFFALRKVGF